MSAILQNVLSFLKSLRLEEKLSPKKNHEIIWFYIFLPALLIYLSFLSKYLNLKPLIGSVEVLDPTFTSLFDADGKIEIIAANLSHTEGPLWINDDNSPHLLFSDTRQSRIYKWEEGKGMFTIGKTIFIDKSGCRNNESYCNSLYEPGSNGLIRKDENSFDIIACLHGERAVGLLRDNGTRSLIATHYKGSRLNSPNDIVWSPEGHLYFTDPPYGLMDKPHRHIQNKELEHHGVYMIKSDYVQLAMELGEPTVYVRLLEGKLNRPNGLAFSPDFSKLYITNSDHDVPSINVYDVTDDGSLKNGKIFFDAKELYENEKKAHSKEGKKVGVPDGLKVDINGNIFSSGPGGLLVISPSGKLLGRLLIDRPVSNVAFGGDNYLYLTATDIVVRIKIKSKPVRIIRKGKLF
jgi:gluconolactonase